ncbi:hypothetical protein PO909_007891 [Leuciscus waleckii]
MGKLQEFEITFTNSKVVYNPGESISGTVRIKTSHSLQFKGKRRLGHRRLDSCFHERQWTSCFFCDAGFGPIAQSHPNRFWIECVSTGLF